MIGEFFSVNPIGRLKGLTSNLAKGSAGLLLTPLMSWGNMRHSQGHLFLCRYIYLISTGVCNFDEAKLSGVFADSLPDAL